MPFNPLGLQPRLRDGVRADGLVTRSAAGPDSSGENENKGYMGTFRRFTATTAMIVQAPGAAPFHVSPQRLASREKYAVVGMHLPLTVSRDLRKLRIEWDEVPTIDELIARGAPTFTDPDAVAAALEAAWAQVAIHAGGDPPRRMRRAPIDGPNARIMAVGHGANDHEAILGKWELLLSVSIPGRPRYGYRYTKRIPRKRIVLPGADIPVDVEGDRIEIPWERIGAAWSAVPAAAERPATLRSFSIGDARPALGGPSVRLDLTVEPADGAPYDVSIDQVLPPAIAQTLAAGQRVTVKIAADDPQQVMLWNTPHAAGGADPDTGRPVDEERNARLEKLEALRSSGALTDDEFAAQKARIVAG